MHEFLLGKLITDETDGLLYLETANLSNSEFITLVDNNRNQRTFEGLLNDYTKSLKDTDCKTWNKVKHNSIFYAFCQNQISSLGKNHT